MRLVSLPGDMGDRINDRLDLHGRAARSVDSLFNDAGEVTGAVTWMSVIGAVVGALASERLRPRLPKVPCVHPT